MTQSLNGGCKHIRVSARLFARLLLLSNFLSCISQCSASHQCFAYAFLIKQLEISLLGLILVIVNTRGCTAVINNIVLVLRCASPKDLTTCENCERSLLMAMHPTPAEASLRDSSYGSVNPLVTNHDYLQMAACKLRLWSLEMFCVNIRTAHAGWPRGRLCRI